MGIIRAVRLLLQIAARPELVQAFLASPAEMEKQRREHVAKEFLAILPVFPGLEEDTWNHEKRIRTAFACARVWCEERAK